MSFEDQADLEEHADDGAVAIVGMAGRFPGAPDLAAFWRLLREGREGITFFDVEALRAMGVPEEHLANPDFVPAAPVLEGIDLFDADFFGYTPREARMLDPQHRLFLETAAAALESAGYDSLRFPGPVGVFGGTSMSTYMLFNILTNPRYAGPADEFPAMIANDKDFLASRVSYHLDLRGPGVDVQTGCSTSLVATHLACEALHSFQCDIALAGGVSVNVPQRAGYFHEPGGIASPDGHCRVFDAEGAGTLFGSGVGVVALKRLEDAVADGDTITAVIKSSAINNDGSRKVGFTAPGMDGQTEVISRALSLADVSPETLDYV
ncbi:MAG: polyketide synthase, partial [Acidobacteriota bacterium]